MKYKQRAVFLIVALCFVVPMVVYYLGYSPAVPGQENRRANDKGSKVVQEFTQQERICTPQPSEIHSKWIVDDLYDDMNFTTNSRESGGLYVVHEKNDDYKAIRKTGNEPLTIIVVPHSHNDPGWLWTLETYYTVRTRSIITNTVNYIKEHPEFKMIWTEMVFLDIWWKESPEQLRNDLKILVEKGQLEILSGGWVSVDEATTHYMAVLDQLTEGHQWLKEILNVHPNISWSIDPFGYSTSLPYLWRKAGMKDMAVLRLHGALKQYMGNRHLLTFNWRQPWDTKGKNDILCHVEPFTLYNIEYSCGPDQELCKVIDFGRQQPLPADNQPIQIGNGRQAKNLRHFVELLVQQYRIKADYYKHNVLLMPHGDDFRYIYDYEFQTNHMNMKRIMDQINSRPEFNVKIKFGTVGEYFDLLHKEIDKHGSPEDSLSGDFFTYTDRDDEYWSGYYTTRPFDKRMIRYLLENLRTTELFMTFAIVGSEQSSNPIPNVQGLLGDLQSARRTHGLVQHHDAITGTSAHTTVIDFEKRIFNAVSQLSGLLTTSVAQLLLKNKPEQLTKELTPVNILRYQDQPVERQTLSVSQTGRDVVFLNPYTQERREIVSLLVDEAHVEIFGPEWHTVPIQINPFWTDDKSVSGKVFEVYFPVDIPPLGVKVYTLMKATESVEKSFANITTFHGKVEDGSVFPDKYEASASNDLTIASKQIITSFSKNGLLRKVCSTGSSKSCTSLEVDWLLYKGVNSNAYCFGKDENAQIILKPRHFFKVVSGSLVTQVIINHPLFQHIVFIYHTSTWQGQNIFVENYATLLNPEDRDKELFLRLHTSIDNPKMQYYTDANSFQLISRQTRNNYPMAANIFPITSMAVLQDSKTRLNLHSAQAVGIASFSTGSLQVLIDRVPTASGKGLEEAVTDNKPALSKFIIHLEESKNSVHTKPIELPKNRIDFPSSEGFLINDFLQNPLVPFVVTKKNNVVSRNISFLKQTIPCELSLAGFKNFITEAKEFRGTGATFHQRTASCAFRARNDFCTSKSEVNLYKMFKDLSVDKITKTSLTFLQDKEDIGESDTIHIEPMELESYRILWKK